MTYKVEIEGLKNHTYRHIEADSEREARWSAFEKLFGKTTTSLSQGYANGGEIFGVYRKYRSTNGYGYIGRVTVWITEL